MHYYGYCILALKKKNLVCMVFRAESFGGCFKQNVFLKLSYIGVDLLFMNEPNSNNVLKLVLFIQTTMILGNL